MQYVSYIIRILITIGCFYALIIQVMRLIWLYYPDFIKGSSIYKHKEPSRFDLIIYFIAMLIILGYTIYLTVIKIL